MDAILYWNEVSLEANRVTTRMARVNRLAHAELTRLGDCASGHVRCFRRGVRQPVA